MGFVLTSIRASVRILGLGAAMLQVLVLSACGGCSGTPAEFATFAWNGSAWSKGPGDSAVFMAMAYDPDLNSVVGLDENGTTWQWGASHWHSLQTKSCCAGQLTSATVVYDFGARRLLLFNANNNYVWSGNAWKQFGDPSSVQAATYDLASKQLIGIDGEGNTVVFGGARWKQTDAAKMPVWQGALVYDAARRQVVGIDYGLTTGDAPQLVTWDGEAWSRPAAALPFSTFSNSGVIGYDSIQNVVLISNEDSLLAWDGRAISRLGDAPGDLTRAAFDEHAGQLLWQKQTKDPTGQCF